MSEKFRDYWLVVFAYAWVLAVFFPQISEGEIPFGFTLLMAIGVKSVVEQVLEALAAYFEAKTPEQGG